MLEKFQLLDEEAQKLKTGCEMRNAEIDNIRQVIGLAHWSTQRGHDTGNAMESVVSRLEALRANPLDAGNHQQFKL